METIPISRHMPVCWKRKAFRLRLKVLVFVSSCSDGGRLFQAFGPAHENELSSDTCAAVRIIDCRRSADKDEKWSQLMQWHSFEDSRVLFLCEVDASADIDWTQFAVRRTASDGFSKSGSRDHVVQDAPPRRDAAFWTRCNTAVVDEMAV